MKQIKGGTLARSGRKYKKIMTVCLTFKGYAMSKLEELKQNFAYAVTNGYLQDFNKYAKNAYSAYSTICKRCVIVPMTYTKWVNS